MRTHGTLRRSWQRDHEDWRINRARQYWKAARAAYTVACESEEPDFIKWEANLTVAERNEARTFKAYDKLMHRAFLQFNRLGKWHV
jgi:hypothetical protein